MTSGGKRGAGERVLESKHVIGLFLLMLLFSGVFFTLGYVMGRNQYDGQVGAAARASSVPEPAVVPKNSAAPKKAMEEPAPAAESDPSTIASHSDWEYPATSLPAKSEPRLEPAPKPAVMPPASKAVSVKTNAPAQPVSTAAKGAKGTTSLPLISNGAYVLQVAALMKQDDALAIANGLQKKHYAAFVLTPQKDKYYRVQVGPYKDQKTADAAKKGLEGEGFKAFYARH